ncbi:hypothetical protein LTS10_005940 [Elasticomyces elasticus]|nr:hypothetical protein LTS10_005940 [Elasticomyces elasticus]
MNYTYADPHKRFKSADGTPVSMSMSNGAANLPAWTPPPAVAVSRGVGGNPARSRTWEAANYIPQPQPHIFSPNHNPQQQQQIMPTTRRTTTRSTSARNSPQPYSKKANSRAPSPSTSPAATALINRAGGLKLTVKAPPSKLRQATTGRAQQLPPNPYTPGNENGGASSGRPARTTRNPKRVVEEEESDDDEDVEEEDGEGGMDVDEAEVDNELLGMADDGDSEDDAEGEEVDGMMDAHPPPPIIKQTVGQGGRPSVKVTAPPITTATGALKSVEAKEMGGSSSSPSLSELSEGDEEDIDQTLGPDEDEIEEESADDLSEDDENSRSATPDLSKLTRRQRGLYVPEPETASVSDGAGLMALSNEALKKKVFSEEEHAMRRQEMARRRKMLSEKRGEEEKMETINKLLSKPAPKRRTRAEMIAAQYAAEHNTSNGTPNPEDGEMPVERADPGFTRYVQNSRGARLGVPAEWEGLVAVGMGLGLGRRGVMVEEVT